MVCLIKKGEIGQDKKIRTTTTIIDNNNPIWDFKQELNISFLKSNLENYKILVRVYDKDLENDEFIGKVDIPLIHICQKPNKLHNNIYDLVDEQGNQVAHAQIEIELKLIS